MVTGLLVTHGGFGEALIRVVEGFLGPQERLFAISNTGLSAERLDAAIAERLRSVSIGEGLFLFTDLVGGSCASACVRLAAGRGGCTSITGVNVPMLLEFCHYRERLSGEELLERVLRKGRDGIGASRGAGAR